MPSLSTFNKDAKTCFYAYILVHSTVQMNIWQMELCQNCKVQEVPGYCLNVLTALFTVPFNSYSKSNYNPTYVLYNADLPSTPSTKRAYTIHFLILSTKRAALIECNCTSCWDATTRTILSLVMSRGGFLGGRLPKWAWAPKLDFGKAPQETIRALKDCPENANTR